MSDIMSFSPLWGEWHIKDLIGKGTFGAVYRAEKTEYGNTYTSAVKHISIPHDNVNPESLIADGLVPDEKSVPLYYDALRNQMITEINFCYTLRGNTNIVSYEDHCIIPKDNGIGYDIFIRMEYLTALPKYMREHYFDENCVIQLGIDICAALEVLDKHQIIHRDIKPANIFVNAVGVYKLGDFGESKVLSGSNAGMTVRGTYTYMSPEISRGGQADIRSDIYSLGIVMYRLLNGNKAPFVPADQPTVDTAAVEAANVRRFRGDPLPKPPYCQNPTLADVILKACAFAPEQRWQKPKQFRKALESIQEAIKSGGQTAAAQPAPPPAAPTLSPDGGNKKKPVPLLIAAAAAVLTAAVVLIILLSRPKPSPASVESGASSELSQVLSEVPSAVTPSETTSEPTSSEIPSAASSSVPETPSSVSSHHTEEPSAVSSVASQEPSAASSDVSEPSTVSSQEPSEPEGTVSFLSLSTLPQKMTYALNESLSTEGLTVTAVYEDGTQWDVPLSLCTIEGFDSRSVGRRTITVAYGGQKAAFAVTVEEKAVSQNLSSGACGDSVSYVLAEDGTLTISGQGAMSDYALSYVVLENNTVGVQCTHPWLAYADRVKRVVVEEGVTHIGSYAFYDHKAMTQVVLPDTVTSLGESCFRNCQSLMELPLSKGITALGEDYIVNCTSLQAIHAAADNRQYASVDGVLYTKDKTTLLKCPEAKAGSVGVDAATVTIGEWAFDNCTQLSEVILTPNVTTIEKFAFSNCRGISSMFLLKNVEKVGASAFRYWQTSQSLHILERGEPGGGWSEAWNRDCQAQIIWNADQYAMG